ncbi:ABC transporter ATP-binding protein [Ramlibacter sp.]|uniref:ABC transporter ATP-binding protein n=1 Tax=Ramlibacter sp. TaxID=1917967 RepID=UPI002FCAE185
MSAVDSALLQVRGLKVHYRNVQAVHGVDLDVREGEVVAVLGANGAGKSSIIKSLMGLVPCTGEVQFAGAPLAGTSAKRVEAGLAYVPEGRRVFGDLSVEDNLRMGGYIVRDANEVKRRLDGVYELFTRLGERRLQLAATLSGGEQQMLALGRALMRQPRLLLLDEPSLGLAPIMVQMVYRLIERIAAGGMTILLSEQSAHIALKLASRAYVLETGGVAFSGAAAELQSNPALREAYLGSVPS